MPPREDRVHSRMPDIGAEDFENQLDEPAPTPVSSAEPAKSVVPEEPDGEWFRIVGELFHSYIVVELTDEVMYIDKHAAHERILYNKLKQQETGVASQILLEPIVLPLSADDLERIDEQADALVAAGIEAEPFGGDTLLVRGIPQHIDASQTGELIADICGRIRRGEPDEIRENILHAIACKAAIKAGWHTAPEEQEALVRQVLQMPDVRYCPHGRPVALVTSRRELEKGFRRVL